MSLLSSHTRSRSQWSILAACAALLRRAGPGGRLAGSIAGCGSVATSRRRRGWNERRGRRRRWRERTGAPTAGAGGAPTDGAAGGAPGDGSADRITPPPDGGAGARWDIDNWDKNAQWS